MKKITILKRDENYSNIAGLSSSLEHSLRIRTKDFDNLVYDDELSKDNKIFYKNEFKTGNNKDDNQAIFDEILSQIKSEVNANTKTDYEKVEAEKQRKFKHKLMKFVSKSEEGVKDYVLNAIEDFKKFDSEQYKSLLESNGAKRINEKVNCLKSYCDLSEKLQASKLKKLKSDTNVVKEVILVIPKKNDVDVSEKTSDFLLQTAVEYYKENHPNNEILAGFSHSDESTNHCHLFINMKNSKTNEYDFVKQEQALAEKNKALSIREQPTPEDFEHPNRDPKRKNKLLLDAKNRWRGETLQRVFYKKFNDLSQQSNMQLEAVFNVKSSATDEAYKFMNEQSKLPKHLRKLSFINFQTEEAQKKLEEQNEATNKVVGTRKKNEVVIQKQIAEHSKRNLSLEDLNVEAENTERSLKNLKAEETLVKARIDKLNQDEETQKESFKKFTQEYFTKIFDEMKTLYQQVLGLKPLFDRNLKRFGLGKVFLKNDLLDEEEFDNRVKQIVRDKSTASLELFNSIDRHYDKNDKDFEARTKKWTHKEVKHRAANNRISENEFTQFLDRSAPESRPTYENSQSQKNKLT
ncbi:MULTISPECIES: hypothetical protein [Pseudomonas]|jgi:hypothetical protein|uniref:Uncharacterized protein n=1 Tax=Pseudomonas fluorescens TaxID=294 RepID=A0A109LAJ7_PSEFL|nr:MULTISPECIES: hypothetical protein [Pseudomonas]KWV84036.1 hypothetical protein PFLmoz3_06027 [Pseudomonas fluorescens]MBI6583821.1 hypothetical protein [Pseudomonas synxantha]MBJ2248460.1 hypothetical protein [Pseudomonas haemolytica]